MPEWTNRTGIVSLVNGKNQSDSHFVTICEPSNPFSTEAYKGSLYILTEADHDTADSRKACHLVAQVIQKAFYEHTSPSVPSSLRAAIRAANGALYRHTNRIPMHQRANVRVSCVALNDHHLVLVQTSPTQVFLMVQGKIRSLPAYPAWNSLYSNLSSSLKLGVLGSSLFIEPEIARSSFHPGDALLFCSSNLSSVLHEEQVATILHQRDISDAIEHLGEVCTQKQLPNAHGIIIKQCANQPSSSSDEKRDSRLSSTSEPNNHPSSPPSIIGTWFARLTTASTHPSYTLQPGEQAHHSKLHTHQPSPAWSLPPSASSASSAFLGETGTETGTTTDPAPDPGTDTDVTISHQNTEDTSTHTVPPPPSLQHPSSQPHRTQAPAQAPARQTRNRSSWFSWSPWISRTSWAGNPFWRMRIALMALGHTHHTSLPLREPVLSPLPPRKKRPDRLEESQQPSFSWSQFLVLVLGIVLLLGYGSHLSQQSVTRRAMNYIEHARSYLADIQHETDYASVVQQMEHSREIIDYLRASPVITTTNPTLWVAFQEVEQDYDQGLARLYGRTVLDSITLLSTHPMPTGSFESIVIPSPPTSNITDTVSLQALRFIYALDTTPPHTQLYRIPRDGGNPQPYLFQASEDGPTRIPNTRLLAQVWHTGRIAAIERAPNNSMFTMYARSGNTWTPIVLGDTGIEAIHSRIDLESYNNNLYLWSSDAQEIIKFQDDNLEGLPWPWLKSRTLNTVDLNNVVDMSVDGKIYLLRSDGAILVFHLGEFEYEMVASHITPPPGKVTRFCETGTPENGALFILDPDHQRVLQIDKQTRAFVQQLVVAPDSPIQLDQLKALAVDESTGKPVLYLVQGSQVLRVTVPDPPSLLRPPGGVSGEW